MQHIHEQLRNRSRGQVLVMVALMMPVFIGMVGLALDSAVLFSERRQMQASVDLAALAGSLDLTDDPDAAEAAALANAATNGYALGVVATTPYDDDPAKIEVVITQAVDTYFMGLFGFETVDVTARAVAIHDIGTTAIFAGKNTCGSNNEETIHWSGSTSGVIAGDVHSNSGIKISGSDNDLGATTYNCTLDVSGSNNSFELGPTQTGIKPWPVTLSTSDFTPWTYGSLTSGGDLDLSGSGAWWVNPSTKTQLKPGVYCSTGKLVLGVSDVSGTVTFVAKKWVHVSGSNFNLQPFMHDVLLYSEGTDPDAVKISGSGGSFVGLLYAPNGQVDISGSSNFSVSGSIVAWTIKLSGSDWTINGTLENERVAQLIE